MYGGWRGLYHLAIEPWVGHPVRFEQAIEAGRQLILVPGQPVEYEVTMIAYSGLFSVSGIQRNGVNYKVRAATSCAGRLFHEALFLGEKEIDNNDEKGKRTFQNESLRR